MPSWPAHVSFQDLRCMRYRDPTRATDPRRGERGGVLIWALLIVVLTSTMIISHTTFLSATRRDKETTHNRDTLAKTLARSGMTDVIGWFRRQAKQPVTAFAPELDPDGIPPAFDTIEPELGLVREFKVHGNLWGRYEARYEDIADVSNERGELPSGSCWDVGVRSYLFRKIDDSKPFNEAPNRMVTSLKLASEIRTVRVQLPAPAAVAVDDTSALVLGANTKIDGGSLGAAIASSSSSVGLPTFDVASVVTGTPAQLSSSVYDAEAETVFGMRLDELRSYADHVIIPGKTDVPKDADGNALYKDGIYYIKGDVASWAGVVIDNALVIYDGNYTKFGTKQTTGSGVVYIKGNATIDQPYTLDGALIGRQQLKLGPSGKAVIIRYSSAAIDKLRALINSYRERRSRSPG